MVSHGRRGEKMTPRTCTPLGISRHFLYLNFFVSFTFALFEIFSGIFKAHSAILVADGSFMVVDALTYAMNIWADGERETSTVRDAGRVCGIYMPPCLASQLCL